MDSTITDLRQHRNFMDTVSAIFEFLRSALRPYFKAVGMIAGPYIVVASIATGVYYHDVSSLAELFVDDREVSDIILPLVIMYCAYIAASLLLMATTYSFMRFSQRERRYPEVDEVRNEMKGTMAMVIGSSILIVLMEIPAFLFLVIPGIWIAVPLALVIPIRYNEDLSFSDAVTRAFRLVKERWWWTFGIMVLCYLAQSVAASIFTLPATILTMLGALSATEGVEPSTVMQIVVGVFGAVGQLAGFLFSTILLVATAAIYYNHVERLDATQLTDRVSSLNEGIQA